MAYPHPAQQNYVSNPSVPYVGTIPNGVRASSLIYIQGIVPGGAQRFHINLQCAAPPPPQSDVALHFNPRFGEQVVVRNAMKGKNWLGEERNQPYFPFAHNTPFEIIVLVEQNQFKVAVNGQHFAQFSHRVINLKRITHMRIGGQVQIYSIRYEQGAVPPPPAPAGPILNPSVPYSDIIPGGVQPGKRIYIDGLVPAGAQRFHINLKCNNLEPPKCDVALHFNPRFPAQVVVRNAMKGQKWLAEERGQPYFPFIHNSPFNIVISVEPKQFKVAVNGNHFTEFNHRVVNLKRITHLSVGGQVQIYSIRYEGGATPVPAPMPAPVPAPAPAFQPALQNVVMNPPVPYVAPIAGGMTSGKMIFISGVVNPNPDRFHVNLQCGPRMQPRANVAFHFNPRFQARKIVRNTLMNQKWGAEESNTPNFPFIPNSFFEIIVLCQPDAYRVAVNGQHLLEYPHRIAFQQVSFLEIDGAVRLTQVRLQ